MKQYLTAMSKGDLDGMQAHLTADGRKAFQEQAKSVDLKTMLPMMKEQAQYSLSLPDAAVTVEDGVAEVVLSVTEGKSKQKMSSRWREDNGTWRQVYP